MNRIPQINSRICKSKRLLLIAGLLIVVLGGLAFADSTGTIMGMVVEKRTNRAVLNAIIILKELNCRISLDSTYGLYEFWNIPAGSYTLVAEYLGSECEFPETVVIKPGSRTWLDLELASDSKGAYYLDIRHLWQPPSADTQVPVRSHTMKYEPVGTISGKVSDKKTKQGLPGANIYLKDTSKGASVNSSDGSYIIRDIPIGKYTIQVSLIGYHIITVKDVIVKENEETNLDFELVSGCDNSWDSCLNISNGMIIGRTRDSETGKRITGVQITIVENEKQAISDSTNGIFKFDNIPAGSYTLSAVRKGYNRESKERIKVTALSTTYLDFKLKPDSAGVMGIIIEAPAPSINKDEIIICPGPNNPPRYGTITGIVTDSQTGLPIPGARILIDSTSMGAMVNPATGTYSILDVTPGIYSLIADCIGFNKCSVTNVTVSAGLAIEINFELISPVIKHDEMCMGNGPPLITKDVSQITRVDKSHLNALPCQSIDKVIKYLCN